MDKILIVKASAFGDIIHVYPCIDYLRRKFPHAQIDWVVERQCADLVQSHPYVTRTLPIATKAWRESPFDLETLRAIKMFRQHLREVYYDVAFDLQGNLKSGLVVSQTRAAHKVGFGRRSVSEWPNLLFTNRRIDPPSSGNIRQDYLAIVSSFFNDPIPLECGSVQLQTDPVDLQLQNSRPNVLICPGSAWRNKQLTQKTFETFLSLLQKFMGCHYLFIWGSHEERQVAEGLHKTFAKQSQVIEKMSLPMLQNFMGMSDLVIAMDSLPLHLAGTTTTPSFSVFGASSAEKYKPLGENHSAFQGKCPYGRTFAKRCPVLRTCSTGACIRSLSGEEIFEHFRSWWTARREQG